MQREKNVKIKEVIATLSKLLSALDVESVPTAESFRRAKFNKTDAVQDLWQLLWGLLRKAFEPDCACAHSTDPERQWAFVRSALWHSGYGARWVVGSPAWTGRDEIGSRELLLAAGWLLASGNVLEALLRGKVQELDVLSSSFEGASGVTDPDTRPCEGDRRTGQDLKSLQWQFGRLKLRWRSLLAVQREQARLSHEVSSSVCAAAPTFDTGTADVRKSTGSTALDEDLERVRTLNRILEVYLEWTSVEPLFWCWMDSVVDVYLPDGRTEGPVDVPQVVSRTCSDGAEARRPVRRLDETSTRLRNQLQTTRLQTLQSSLCSHAAVSPRDGRPDATGLGPEQKAEVERRVASRLHGLSVANEPSAVAKGVMPYFQRPRPSGSVRRAPGRSEGAGCLQACLKELRERRVVLEWELELLRRSQRERIQAWGGETEGLLLIPPLKR